MMDTENTAIIKALDAAKFLMKSGLSDVVLSRVSSEIFAFVSQLRLFSCRSGICQIQTEMVIWTSQVFIRH